MHFIFGIRKNVMFMELIQKALMDNGIALRTIEYGDYHTDTSITISDKVYIQVGVFSDYAIVNLFIGEGDKFKTRHHPSRERDQLKELINDVRKALSEEKK